MKRHFGTLWTRSWLGAGTNLTAVEHRIAKELVSALPDWLRSTVESQFEAYNLVQREVDGRQLNFFRKTGDVTNDMGGLPTLEMMIDEAPLVRMTFRLGDTNEPIHATLNAVGGRVFCIAFSQRVDKFQGATDIAVLRTKDAWRSNFPRTDTHEG